jgi:hypothetical protein
VKPLIVAVCAGLATVSAAAPAPSWDACYVRTEPAESPAAAASAASAGAQSFIGLRRKSDKLFELDISIAGPNDATCAVAGIAKPRGDAGAETLAMVVRPDPSRKSGRSGTLCQIFVQLTPAALELRTTPTPCQAQALCEGKVELDGQRFGHASKLPAGAKGPCFEKRAP